jgi:hypothetical protein
LVEEEEIVTYPVVASVEFVFLQHNKARISFQCTVGRIPVRRPRAGGGARRQGSSAHVHAKEHRAGFTAEIILVVKNSQRL